MNNKNSSYNLQKQVTISEIIISFIMILTFNIMGVFLVIWYFWYKFKNNGQSFITTKEFSKHPFGKNFSEFLEALVNPPLQNQKKQNSYNNKATQTNTYNYNTKHTTLKTQKPKYGVNKYKSNTHTGNTIARENVTLESQKNTNVKKVKVASIWDDYESVTDMLKKKYNK